MNRLIVCNADTFLKLLVYFCRNDQIVILRCFIPCYPISKQICFKFYVTIVFFFGLCPKIKIFICKLYKMTICFMSFYRKRRFDELGLRQESLMILLSNSLQWYKEMELCNKNVFIHTNFISIIAANPTCNVI